MSKKRKKKNQSIEHTVAQKTSWLNCSESIQRTFPPPKQSGVVIKLFALSQVCNQQMTAKTTVIQIYRQKMSIPLLKWDHVLYVASYSETQWQQHDKVQSSVGLSAPLVLVSAKRQRWWADFVKSDGEPGQSLQKCQRKILCSTA